MESSDKVGPSNIGMDELRYMRLLAEAKVLRYGSNLVYVMKLRESIGSGLLLKVLKVELAEKGVLS